jgi:hypothetical protein
MGMVKSLAPLVEVPATFDAMLWFIELMNSFKIILSLIASQTVNCHLNSSLGLMELKS